MATKRSDLESINTELFQELDLEDQRLLVGQGTTQSASFTVSGGQNIDYTVDYTIDW